MNFAHERKEATKIRTKTSEKKKWGAIVAGTAIMAALALAAAQTLLQSASAAITSHCENRGGHEAPGQQENCQGEGQEQSNQNPAGKEPPGQNKDD
ncbi:hypothetical protein [Nitrososphaera viennensis]|uniref:Uncharacterized protein n=2 Tax=Nitrososphaera viennensis TaxID=1034015 RepID=A0A060HS57_9ARCH|nr:hypothetical protein [Nitrososphaera viennensis]AIC15987.1 hypothetical protein NVIE_017260 [Nitrososphaera viennensis EN76]UVS67962.1 hypothetical protein NWT39_08600 [Nitrososphaera viennensis]